MTNKNNWSQEEKQIKVLEEHGKQLIKYIDEKESLTHSKQKDIFVEIANKRMEKILNGKDLVNNLILIIYLIIIKIKVIQKLL